MRRELGRFGGEHVMRARRPVVDECGVGVVRRIRPATFEVVLLFVFGGDEGEFGEFDSGCDGWVVATFELFE